jgi:enoyl-CoA hydratase/carnithine racemase
LQGVLPRNIAFEMIATGEPIDAARAHAFGMVNRLTPPGGALAAARDLAEAIAANAPIAVQQALHAARATSNASDTEARAVVAQALDRVRATDDYAEGPRAFLEKRAPRWTGR